MNPIWKKVKEYAKTITVFLAGVVGPPLLRIVSGEDPLPQNKQEWVNWITAIAVSTLAAAFTRNKITQKQLDKDPNVIGGKVIDDLPPVQDNSPRQNYYPTDPGGAWPKR